EGRDVSRDRWDISFPAPDRNASRSQSLRQHIVRLHYSGHDRPQTRLHRDAHLQYVICIGQRSSSHVAVVCRGLRCQLRTAAQRKVADSRTIDSNLDFTSLVQTADHVLKGPLKAKLENILAIDGKVMARGNPAARAQ